MQYLYLSNSWVGIFYIQPTNKLKKAETLNLLKVTRFLNAALVQYYFVVDIF